MFLLAVAARGRGIEVIVEVFAGKGAAGGGVADAGIDMSVELS